MWSKTLLWFAVLSIYLSCSRGSPVDVSAGQPIIYNQGSSTIAPLVPHSVNLGAETFLQPAPVTAKQYSGGAVSSYSSGIMLPIQEALMAVVRFFKDVGYLLFGGIGIFVLGGIFTTFICSVTPFCTVTFNGWSGMDSKEVMRSLMTPERLSTAASMVQDAISRYDRLQRSNRDA